MQSEPLVVYPGPYRLYNPFLFGSALVPRSLQQLHITGKTKGLGKEVELLLPVLQLHFEQILPKSVLNNNMSVQKDVGGGLIRGLY